MAVVPDRARQAFRILHVGFVVAVWLWAIIVNLLVAGDHYDIALRDFGLSLGALALARLAEAFPSGSAATAAATSRQRSP
jgi:hypothetical protein